MSVSSLESVIAVNGHQELTHFGHEELTHPGGPGQVSLTSRAGARPPSFRFVWSSCSRDRPLLA